MWRQPKAVWAVAFASVVAFMGIGLVDPILKPIAGRKRRRLGGVQLREVLRRRDDAVAGGCARRAGERAHAVLGRRRSVLLGAGVLALSRSHLQGIEETDLDDVSEATAIMVGSDS